MNLIPFEVEHLQEIKRDFEFPEKKETKTFFSAFEEDRGHAGYAYTGVHNDNIIGCGGIYILWHGCGEAWATYPLSFRSNIYTVWKYTKKMLQNIIKEHKLHRVQAIARSDFPGGINWLKHLGFEIEGTLRRYCPNGEDAYMCAILTDIKDL